MKINYSFYYKTIINNYACANDESRQAGKEKCRLSFALLKGELSY